MIPTLEIEGLRKEYKGFTLKDVSFKVPPGYIMGLIGPNGAGKTTIIKLILNLIRRDAGEIKVFGLENIQNEVEVKSRIGFVHEAPAFYDYLKLKQMKSIIARFYSKWDDSLFHKLCSEFALPLDKRISRLSRGMKMKFSLALALSHEVDFILMDEPTSGLDPVFRRELLERLSGLIQDEKKSVLFSTHITSDLERTADYITYIQDGEILFSDTKDEILENWAIIKGGNNILDDNIQAFFQGVVHQTSFGFKALTGRAQEARRILSGQEVVIEKASLDDLMFFLSRRDSDA